MATGNTRQYLLLVVALTMTTYRRPGMRGPLGTVLLGQLYLITASSHSVRHVGCHATCSTWCPHRRGRSDREVLWSQSTSERCCGGYCGRACVGLNYGNKLVKHGSQEMCLHVAREGLTRSSSTQLDGFIEAPATQGMFWIISREQECYRLEGKCFLSDLDVGHPTPHVACYIGAHLLTSAVNWKSASEYRPLNQTAGSSGTVVSTPAWRAYLESTTDRRETMIRATRNVGIITFNTEPLKPDYCRHVVRGQDLAVDSKVDNDTFPCFDC